MYHQRAVDTAIWERGVVIVKDSALPLLPLSSSIIVYLLSLTKDFNLSKLAPSTALPTCTLFFTAMKVGIALTLNCSAISSNSSTSTLMNTTSECSAARASKAGAICLQGPHLYVEGGEGDGACSCGVNGEREVRESVVRV